ncbi:site-specific integrase [Clostridium manihotivorum]|uniref:Site-specific integrase n=1 Tax=Clostridium manihotivorum TaxID=2320868 RepID=A0A3R5QVD9_9CLOT|nr:site-specific integrase [Clostridium manihotivorum]QAA30364.1 hypothetical protein C1I91_00960 [Clostridium manihotivorum]
MKKSNGEGSINKYKNGWRATITIGRDDTGKLKRKQFYGRTKSEVISKMNDYKSKSTFGLISKDEKITLQEWMNFWLTNFKVNDSRPATIERYNGIYRNYIKNSEIGVIKLKDLKSSHVQAYYNTLAKNKSANIVKTLHKLLKSGINQACREQYIIINPCTGVKTPKVEEKEEVQAFSLIEQHSFLSYLDNSKHRLRTLFKLDLSTGLRLGEIIALRWCDIDFINNNIKISRTLKRVAKINSTSGNKTEIIEQPPKTKNSARTVPFPSSMISELNHHKRRQLEEKLKAGDAYNDNDLVFATELGHPIDGRNLSRSFHRILNNANISDKKFHSLRHTYATRLFERGVSLKTVQKLLGHSKLEITANIYTHVHLDEKIKAVELLNDVL